MFLGEDSAAPVCVLALAPRVYFSTDCTCLVERAPE